VSDYLPAAIRVRLSFTRVGGFLDGERRAGLNIILDFQRCLGRQYELKDPITIREYLGLKLPFPDGHAMLDNIVNSPPSRLSAQFRALDGAATFNL